MIEERCQVSSTRVIHTWRQFNEPSHLIFCVLLITAIASAHLVNVDRVLGADATSTVTKSSLVIPYKGTIPKGPFKFPLYKGEGYQYFSAGIGIEERQAKYPPYPLKLILVQGKRAYLSTVSLKIRQLDGTLTFQIPSKHVEGPWIFLKVPTGTYLVTATNHQQQTIEKQVSINEDKSQVVYLRWLDS